MKGKGVAHRILNNSYLVKVSSKGEGELKRQQKSDIKLKTMYLMWIYA